MLTHKKDMYYCKPRLAWQEWACNNSTYSGSTNKLKHTHTVILTPVWFRVIKCF